MKSMNKFGISFVMIMILSMILMAGCQPGGREIAKSQEPTKETAEVTEDKVGGTMVLAMDVDLPTLDPTFAVTERGPMQLLGASLVTKAPDSNTYIPYAAESWEISEDGLVWDFKIKKGITFHDGSPCTAQDFAWTYNRARNPDTGATVIGSLLEPLESAEAIDDYTLRLTLNAPYFPLMESLSMEGYMQPLPQTLVEELGDEFSMNFVGIGPYKLKEWQTGNKIVLERNPDFNWGPEFGEGPFNIEFLEFRILPEYAIIVSGLESGDIDFGSIIPVDVPNFDNSDEFVLFETFHQGTAPVITMDVNTPPFDNLNVRKAINYAIDRQAMIDIAVLGNGIVQYGPLSPSQIGYSKSVEKIGYGYDPDQARMLLEEAGYTLNANDIYEKAGTPLSLTLRVYPKLVKDAEIVQQQLKAIGIDVTIQQDQEQTLDADWLTGKSQFTMGTIGYPEADILFLLYHSSFLGVLNYGNINDPVLDEMLERTRTETDIDARQAAVTEAQEYIVEQAYIVPIYVPIKFSVMNSRIKDVIWSPLRGDVFSLILNNAYIE